MMPLSIASRSRNGEATLRIEPSTISASSSPSRTPVGDEQPGDAPQRDVSVRRVLGARLLPSRAAPSPPPCPWAKGWAHELTLSASRASGAHTPTSGVADRRRSTRALSGRSPSPVVARRSGRLRPRRRPTPVVDEPFTRLHRGHRVADSDELPRAPLDGASYRRQLRATDLATGQRRLFANRSAREHVSPRALHGGLALEARSPVSVTRLCPRRRACSAACWRSSARRPTPIRCR